ncbi:MAG: glycoside hydrolase family 9 protein [Tannerellaceae bacterium]|nr:glycoside hydrolase family 9 protein [Tannerellaceae bacterium]
MKNITAALLLFFVTGHLVYAFPEPPEKKPAPELKEAIIRTGVLHSPLPLDHTNSYDSYGLKKKILDSTPIIITENLDGWEQHGLGQGVFSGDQTISGTGSIRLEFPTYTGKRIQGPPSDPDYATYGYSSIELHTRQANWENYNRIAFSVYPDCEGARVVNLNLVIENAPGSTQPGLSSCSHLINLTNREWNRCFLDIDDLQRDQVSKLGFHVTLKGKDRTTGDVCTYYIDQIELQQIEDPEIVSGWQSGLNRMVYSTSGYMANHRKTALIHQDTRNRQTEFRLIRTHTNQIVYTGKIRQEKTSTGTFDVLDFTAFDQPGDYYLSVGTIATPSFPIGNNIWENSLWRTLNFIFCQRCGYPVPGKHGTCHLDLCSRHDGKMISYAGGWHDAGDLSQQTLQTGDVTYILLEGYTKLKDRQPLLAMRLLEEAEWGLEFILRNRYGDGYRASSAGLLIWQDGISGTLDDITTVRVQNCALDNFLYAAYEAYAALTIDRDPMLQEYLQRVAKEDFAFGLRRHEEVGYGEFHHFYEHTYNTSESQYMATISWAASMLYKLTQDPYYAEKAAEFIQYTLDCQRTEPLKDPGKTHGFFYRDLSKTTLVHYNHQSREQIYMQAMILLCETQPDHPDYTRWDHSIRIYGNYLKNLMQYTAPYGMLPSGVYHIDEVKDEVSFDHQHLFQPADAKENYVVQVKNGVPLDQGHYVKRFPVWFSIFNGNTVVHLSTGKAAAICGKYLQDEELIEIGREQLYWTVGKNPFGQSLIYGEGHRYPRLDNFSSGETVGAMPVGIRSLGNEDVPYWPTVNNATYKEVWVTSTGKWISLAVEYEE